MTIGRYYDFSPDLTPLNVLANGKVTFSGSTQGLGDVYRLDMTPTSAPFLTLQTFFGVNGRPIGSELVFLP